MCIGDATAQPTRPGLRSSCQRAAEIAVSTRAPFHVRATEPFGARPVSCGSPVHGDPGRGALMSLGAILIILLILVLLGVIPSWGYSGSWGYGPSGIIGTILVIVLILVLLGRI